MHPRQTHQLSKHLLYGTWTGMMTRCYNTSHVQYHNYGGRGISVCPRWRDPVAFIEDIERTLGARPAGMSLDRIRGGLGYKPSNVRWATQLQQAQNRRGQAERDALAREWLVRRRAGETIASLAREAGIDASSVSRRVRRAAAGNA